MTTPDRELNPAIGSKEISGGDTDPPPNDFYVIFDKPYAEDSGGQLVNPANADQIITATARLTRDGMPAAGRSINWSVFPYTGYLRLFDEHDQPIDPEGPSFATVTGPDGSSRVKVGSTLPFLGKIYAKPPDGANISKTITIMTVDVGGGFYSPPILPFDSPVTIPTDDRTFDILVPPAAASGPASQQTAAVWLRGKGQPPLVKAGSLSQAMGGVQFPYSSLAVGENAANYAAYLISDLASNVVQSTATVFAALGHAQSTHPDHTLHRTLVAPYLTDHASQINSYNIGHGFSVFVPNYAGRAANDKVTVTIYLNGYDANFKAISNVYSLDSHTVSNQDGPDPIELLIPASILEGYGTDASGRQGTFEADYKAERSGSVYWSYVLDGVGLDTIPPE